MQIAFAIYPANFDGLVDGFVDETYGKFEVLSWERGLDENGGYFNNFIYHDYHLCTREELGLQGNASKFYPVSKSMRENFEGVSSLFYCLDKPEDLVI